MLKRLWTWCERKSYFHGKVVQSLCCRLSYNFEVKLETKYIRNLNLLFVCMRSHLDCECGKLESKSCSFSTSLLSLGCFYWEVTSKSHFSRQGFYISCGILYHPAHVYSYSSLVRSWHKQEKGPKSIFPAKQPWDCMWSEKVVGNNSNCDCHAVTYMCNQPIEWEPPIPSPYVNICLFECKMIPLTFSSLVVRLLQLFCVEFCYWFDILSDWKWVWKYWKVIWPRWEGICQVGC